MTDPEERQKRVITMSEDCATLEKRKKFGYLQVILFVSG